MPEETQTHDQPMEEEEIETFAFQEEIAQLMCTENYTGARCEEVFLPSFSIQNKSNLSAAVLVLAVLVALALTALYFLCRKGPIQRASSVQCEIRLVETNSTSTRHSHKEHLRNIHKGHYCCHLTQARNETISSWPPQQRRPRFEQS